jgi:hypothetical protein
LVCFTRNGLDIERLLDQMHVRQIAWMSKVPVKGRPAVRACITSFRTGKDDIDHVVAEMTDLATRSPT